MQANNQIKVATIPFIKGQQVATICGDGEKFAAMWDGVHQAFTSLWWAVEFVLDNGFTYDMAEMRKTVGTAYEVLCVARGYSFRKVGHSWHFFRDGRMVRSSATLWEGQFLCVRDCYTKRF